MLTYVYIGYFIISWLLATPRRARTKVQEWPVVTLIIPAYNEQAVIRRKIQNSLELEYPEGKLEILIASDGSQDQTNEIAASFADRGVRLLAFERRRGKAAAMNDAVEAATGEVICFCDANVIFQPKAVRILVSALADPNVGAATGCVQLASEDSNFGEGESLYYKIEKRLQRAESQVGSLMGVDGGMYVLRKSLYEPLPQDTILDDFVISMKILRNGKRVVYDPEAIANENGTPTAMQEYRRRVRVAAGAVQSIKRGNWPRYSNPIQVWQYLSHKVLRWMGPLWLALFLVSNTLIVIWWNKVAWPDRLFFQITLGIQAIFYGLAILGLFSVAFRQTRLGGIPFYFALSHVAMTVGSIKGLFNRQKVTWQTAERGKVAAKQEGSPAN